MPDRFGLSWRGALAAGILAHRERLDYLEVIADDYVGAPMADLRALATLARHLPVSLHSIQLGMASLEGLDRARLDGLARVVDSVEPESWSEHLAFVRGGGRAIGHLAAPSRNRETLEAVLANLDRALRAIGLAPQVENIATLMAPPASTMSEGQWLGRLLSRCTNHLLLDLHNLHANATNFGFDAFAFLGELPLERVATIHLAGGKWIDGPRRARRWLDDHKHPVPDPVYALLESVAARAPGNLTVILERDGDFPRVELLLDELDLARQAVARGRAQFVGHPAVSPAQPGTLETTTAVAPSGASLQAALTRLYVDDEALRRFLADPEGEARRAGVPELGHVDMIGLEMAARSFARKRRGAGFRGEPDQAKGSHCCQRLAPPDQAAGSSATPAASPTSGGRSPDGETRGC